MFFSVECHQIRDVSSNASLLPVDNIDYSTSLVDYMNISDVWCAYLRDSLVHVNLSFTESVYLLVAVFRGGNSNYVTNFSVTYKNPSGENVTYMNINGVSVRHFNAFMNN